MAQHSKHASMMDAPNMPREEEFAKGMVQKSNDAAVKDVTTSLRKEEFVLGMVQKLRNICAVMKDVPTK